MSNITIEEVSKLKKIFDVIEVFRALDPNINVLTIQTIIEVARKGDAGTSVKGLEKLLGCSGAAASRNLLSLEPKSDLNPKGHGLALPEFDPLDRKAKLRVPSKEMPAFVAKLLHALD